MTNDPASAAKNLGARPSIHRTASVRDTTFGIYCEVGARTKVAESSFGDYSYVVNDSDIIYTTIGKYCSIAAHTRINPGNHPLDRVMLSHVSYRSSAYGLGPDDPSFFDWRRSSPVTLGPRRLGRSRRHNPPRPHDRHRRRHRRRHDRHQGRPSLTPSSSATPAASSALRFPEPVIEALARIAWWDWPHGRLRAAMADIRTLSAPEFCAKHDPGK